MILSPEPPYSMIYPYLCYCNITWAPNFNSLGKTSILSSIQFGTRLCQARNIGIHCITITKLQIGRPMCVSVCCELFSVYMIYQQAYLYYCNITRAANYTASRKISRLSSSLPDFASLGILTFDRRPITITANQSICMRVVFCARTYYRRVMWSVVVM